MILTVFYHVLQTYYDSRTSVVSNVSGTIWNGMGNKEIK